MFRVYSNIMSVCILKYKTPPTSTRYVYLLEIFKMFIIIFRITLFSNNDIHIVIQLLYYDVSIINFDYFRSV